jgi:thioesterase domain-containing protein
MTIINFTQELKIERSEKQIFVIVHGADGSIAPFYPLASLLNTTLVAIGYDPSVVQGCETIEDFARMYLDQLVAQYPNRFYIFAGYSYGGLVAYEMAALAQRRWEIKIPVFMFDPNLPLAMRKYVAHRLYELHVLATSIFSDKQVIAGLDEDQLFKLLSRCLKPERIERILSARKHCLTALSRYLFQEFPEICFHALHASEKLGFEFIDEETKWITSGTKVKGNHFTMFFPEHVEEIAAFINSKIKNSL